MAEVSLEGLHAIKHAVRFGATIIEVLTDDLERVIEMAKRSAPDLVPFLQDHARVVPTNYFRARWTQPIPTHVLGFAEPPAWTLEQCLPTADKPTILLDDPRNSKNLGAVIRVGAAAGSAGVMVLGPSDLYNPMAVRGASGLQWAIPCWSSPDLLSELDQIQATMVGLDASGQRYSPTDFPEPTIFAFGSERTGLSREIRARCDHIASLPMEPEVSSLNLATSVSAVMYLHMYTYR